MCSHENFRSTVNVLRLTDDSGVVVGYAADISIKCISCGTPFEFIGLPLGSSPAYPTISVIGTELRVPIRPSQQVVS